MTFYIQSNYRFTTVHTPLHTPILNYNISQNALQLTFIRHNQLSILHVRPEMVRPSAKEPKAAVHCPGKWVEKNCPCNIIHAPLYYIICERMLSSQAGLVALCVHFHFCCVVAETSVYHRITAC